MSTLRKYATTSVIETIVAKRCCMIAMEEVAAGYHFPVKVVTTWGMMRMEIFRIDEFVVSTK